MIDEWLDAGQVAERLHITRASVYRYVHSGRLVPDDRIGRTPVWRPTTVDQYRDDMAPRGRVAFDRRAARGHDQPEQRTS